MSTETKTSNLSPVDQLERWVAENPSQSIAIGAITILALIVQKSAAETIQGLHIELQDAVDSLKTFKKNSISIAASCAIFARYVSRTNNLSTDFEECKKLVVDRGCNFSVSALRYRDQIAQLCSRFITHNKVILVHGFSRVVLKVLKHAKETGANFRCIVTESRPDNAGYQMARELDSLSIPVSFIMDSAAAHMMLQAHFVLVGAEAVVENGGIINKIGTYQIAMVAKALRRPVYVAAESYKFARLFPLTQSDMPETQQPVLQPLVSDVPASLNISNPALDYTPPEYISMLFTDLGILTPSAVSDELIKLYI